MSSNEDELDDEAPPQAIPVGLDAVEVAEIAKMTDLLTRSGIAVYNFGGITPTDFGVMIDLSLYIQTREIPEDAPPAEPETDRAADAGDVVEGVVEEVGDGDGDE